MQRSVLLLAAVALMGAAAPVADVALSPGYTYRMRSTMRVTDPKGKVTESVVMSGRAMMTATAGRLDIEQGDRSRGAMAEKGDYMLFDANRFMIVSPKEKQVVEFAFDDMAKGATAFAAAMPGMKVSATDVRVAMEKVGAGETIGGVPTERYRMTQEYAIAVQVAFMKRNTREQVVTEYHVAEPRSGLANPFARMAANSLGALGGTGLGELIEKTMAASRPIAHGVILKSVATTRSTDDKGNVTETVHTTEVTELAQGDVDDSRFAPPAGYERVAMGQVLGEASRAAQQQGGTKEAGADSTKSGDAKDAAKGALKRGLRGMLPKP